MRIGIISDTHDHLARTSRAVGLLIDRGVDALIHCGDLTGPDVVHACAGPPSYFVFGNNDFDRDGLRRAMGLIGGVCLDDGGIVEIGGRRIAVTHGDSAREMRRLVAESPDYLLFGHSHVATDTRDGPTRFINPGALHRATEWTLALLVLESDALEFVAIR